MARGDAEQADYNTAQHDQKSLSWVDMNEAVLELDFDVDVPDLPERPWGADALRTAERAALEKFDSSSAPFAEDNRESSWRFVRFLGQTFIDAFDGLWVNLPREDGKPPRVAVKLPFRETHLQPITLLTMAMGRRTGEEWAKVYEYAAVDHERWVAETASEGGGHGAAC